MLPSDLITLERIGFRLEIASKKSMLQRLGTLLAKGQYSLSPDTVFDLLLARERLGSTGFGRGIALPHARVASLDRAIGAFVQLQAGVAFDAIDNLPVDMAFALLVPQEATEEHLQLLAKLAGIFEQVEICDRLRHAQRAEQILAILQGCRS
jgi:PTS system nitrogen regulatory IIA component